MPGLFESGPLGSETAYVIVKSLHIGEADLNCDAFRSPEWVGEKTPITDQYEEQSRAEQNKQQEMKSGDDVGTGNLRDWEGC
jgi:hypothetical protein